LVNELRVRVAAQQHAEIIEPGDDPLQLYAIDQKHRHRRLIFADVIEKDVLNILRLVRCHTVAPNLHSWSATPHFPGTEQLNARFPFSLLKMGLRRLISTPLKRETAPH